MTVEADLFLALKSLVTADANGIFSIFPDVAPAGTAVPYLTFQQVGGQVVSFMESAVVGKRNGRFQLNCWASTRAAAAALSRQVEDALVTNTTLRAIPIGAPIATYEEDTLLYGTSQDFSIWFE
jgi:hypothetical protein